MTTPLRALASAIKTALDAATRALSSANVADQSAKAAAKSALDAGGLTETARVYSTNANASAAGVAASAATATAQAGVATTQAAAANTSAAAANTSAGAAQTAQARAEAARDSVNTTGKVFADTASGIAGTASGQTFAVLDPTAQFWIVYSNSAGAANEVARSYTKVYIDSFASDIGVNVSAGLIPLVFDDAGKVALWLDAGKLAAMGMAPSLINAMAVDQAFIAAVRNSVSTDPATLAAVGAAMLPSLGFTADLLVGASSVPLVSDAAGNVALWLTNGNLDVRGLGTTFDAALQAKVAALNFAPLAGPVSSKLPIATDGRSLYAWRTKLTQMQMGTPAVAKVVLAGDSWTENQYIATELSSLLYSKYTGKSGEGWLDTSGRWTLNGIGRAKSGWTQYDANTGASPTLGCGIDGMSISTTSNTATVSITNLDTTNFDIYYRNGDGTFRYQVDGGAWTAVTGDGTGSIGKVSIAGLSDTLHTINIDTTGNTGTAVLHGYRATRPAVSGIEFSKAGNSGINGAQLSLWASTYVQQYAADILPDLVVIALATNDYQQASTPDQYISALTSYVTAVRAASPSTGFVFIAPADTNGVALRPLTLYRDALYQFCITNGHEFYNMHDDWASWATMNAAGLFQDTLHPNFSGAYLLAKRLHNLLLAL